jgi:protein-S-isoprenylcysteine O-methyltransferase Ste14
MFKIIPWIILFCWAGFILFWAVSAFSAKRDISQTAWKRFALLRITIAFVIVGWLWATSRWGKTANTNINFASHTMGWLAVIGVVFCLAGIALAVWARVHLGRNWSSVPTLKEDHELITSGPYSVVRHPIYSGVMLAVLGSTLTSPVWLAAFVLVTAMFIWRVRVEEALMTKQFPNQYPDYKKRTWALIPYVW